MDFISPFDLFTNCSTDIKLLNALGSKVVSEHTIELLKKQRLSLSRFVSRTAINVIREMDLPCTTTEAKSKKSTPVKEALTKSDVKSKIDSSLKKVKDAKDENRKKYETNNSNKDDDNNDKDIPVVIKKIGEISLEDPHKKKKRKRDLQKITCEIIMKRVPEVKSNGCFIRIDEHADKVSYVLLDDEDKDYFNKKIKTKGGFGIIAPLTSKEKEEEDELFNLQNEIDDGYDEEADYN
jgi:hypothetical protein